MKKLQLLFTLLLVVSAGTIQAQEDNLARLDSLRNSIARVKERVDMLTSKLSFEQMKVLTVVCGDDNTSSQILGGFKLYGHKIRIDDPLCNNNPKALIFVAKQKDNDKRYLDAGRTEDVGVSYNTVDNRWYIMVPDWQLKGFEPDIVVTIALEDGEMYGHKAGEIYFLNTSLIFKTERLFTNREGVAYFGPKYGYEGEKYSVIIFKEALPYMQMK